MDPDACLIRIADAFNAGEANDAIDAMRDMCYWLSKGGFMPSKNIVLEDRRQHAGSEKS